MRFKVINNHLEERVKEKYLYLPMILKRWDKREFRWLERARILQRWHAFRCIEEDILNPRKMLSYFIFGGYWVNEYFLYDGENV